MLNICLNKNIMRQRYHALLRMVTLILCNFILFTYPKLFANFCVVSFYVFCMHATQNLVLIMHYFLKLL